MSVIYVCELPDIKGKFDPAKAMALGLKRGSKYGELQLGNSVKSDYQNIMVHPSDVMGPPIPGPIVLLVDCPTESHLQELLSVQCLSSYYTDSSGPPENAKVVTCVIHLSPSSLISSSNNQRWMKRFGSAQHIMAGNERKNVDIPILKASAKIAARLNYLCPQFFPAPGYWSPPHRDRLAPESTTSNEGSVCESISAENLLKFTLRPYAHLGLDKSVVPSKVTAADVIDDLLSEIPEVVDAAQSVSQFWRQSTETKEEISFVQEDKENTLPSCLENIRRDDLEIVFLGTGSSQPSKYRNVSAIHINLFSHGSLLLDCGEGTLGQLKRRYGVEGADNAVRGLQWIWISHIHADHHTGRVGRNTCPATYFIEGVPHEPVYVIGPGQLKSYLDAYQRLEDLDMQFVDGSRMECYSKRPGIPVGDDPILKSLQKSLNKAGLETLISVPVMHCPEAFGVVLKASQRLNSVGKVIPGWKLVYSGDTRPCPALREASCGATVLINEATFEDGMVDEAIEKKHSTTKEATEVGNSVYRIILTHFSQRYPKSQYLT